MLHAMSKHCSSEEERRSLRDAEELVKFQLRHGNDLLTMDSIRDCDVNLKEQGNLLRQVCKRSLQASSVSSKAALFNGKILARNLNKKVCVWKCICD